MDPSAARAGRNRHLPVRWKAQAMEEPDLTLPTVEGEGDTVAARNALDAVTHVASDMRALLDQAGATVPLSTTELGPLFNSAAKTYGSR